MEQIEQVPQNSKKDLGFLQEIADKFGVNSLEYKQFLKAVEKDRASMNLGLGTIKEKEKPLLSLVKEVLSQIDSVELKKPSKKANKLLDKQKQGARIEIRNLLGFAQKYVAVLDMVQLVGYGKKKLDTKDYQENFAEADAQRRRAHNALFDQAAIVSRYIRFHFGQLSESQLEKFEETEDDSGREVLNIGRKSFPHNLLWPEGINLNDRKSVGEWALVISRELADVAIEKL